MLYILGESFRSALEAIRAHAMRSFLTMLGIIIGVASVVGMVSIIQGVSFSINQELSGLGSDVITITSFTPREDRLQGKIARLTIDDMEEIKARVEGIEIITPYVFNRGTLRYGSQTAVPQVYGSTWSSQDIQQYYVKTGRFISVSDNNTRRRVIVIGETVRTDLALPKNPVGEFIAYNGEWLKVIGLLESRGSLLGQDLDQIIFIPFNTMQSLQGTTREPEIVIQLTVKDLAQLDTIVSQIRTLLRRTHQLDGQLDDFRIETAEQTREMIGNIIGMMTAAMSGILGISLLVAGIGIMNIMLVSVTERTREIGICKAIGAKRHHILLQFLFESVFICLIGGLIGLLLGYGIGFAGAAMVPMLPEAHIPFWAILLAFGFSASVGIIFGILPAAKAANLDPIDALRYE